jgi:hypothetical protein
MAKPKRNLPLILVLALAVGLIAAGSAAIGFAPTLTLLAIASTILIFYLIIQTSRA